MLALTPAERDRVLLSAVADLARRRLARGLALNVPEATAIVADTVCESARDGARLDEARPPGPPRCGPTRCSPAWPTWSRRSPSRRGSTTAPAW